MVQPEVTHSVAPGRGEGLETELSPRPLIRRVLLLSWNPREPYGTHQVQKRARELGPSGPQWSLSGVFCDPAVAASTALPGVLWPIQQFGEPEGPWEPSTFSPVTTRDLQLGLK